MPFNENMVPAEAGKEASSAEYNKVISNTQWLYERHQDQFAWSSQHLGGVPAEDATHDVVNSRLDALETVEAVPYGSFYQATSQTIATTSVSPSTNRLVWDTNETTPVGVSKSDGDRTITLNRSGVWVISVFARFNSSFDADRIVTWLGPPDSGTSERYGFNMIQPTASLVNPGVSFTIQKRVTSGFQFSAYLFQDSGADKDTLTNYNSTALTCTYLGA